MIRALILATAALVTLSVFTPEADARRNRTVVIAKPGKVVSVKPARAAFVVRQACPGRDAVWVAGYWKWCGPRIGYYWVAGHWTVR